MSRLLVVAVGTLALASFACAAATFTADFGVKQHDVAPTLYGVFFEEINFAGEGGLYAEMVRNRDFETLGRGQLPGSDKYSDTPIEGDMRPWTASVLVGEGTISLDASTQPFAANPHVLRVDAGAFASVKVELLNPGHWGMACRAGQKYSASLWVRTSGAASVSLGFSRNGAAVVAASTVDAAEWQRHAATLTCATDESAASLSVVVEVDAGSSVWIDHVSVFPGDAVAGLFRKDLFDMLAALKPAFFRFPGGNFLEGNAEETRWDWKKTLGDPASRPGHYNDAWHYWSTDGLGLYEYYVLCELLHTRPLMSVFTGYFLSEHYTPMADSKQIIQDAVDAIEYANGADTTAWGKARAQAGHAAPFGLERVEVGNEEKYMPEYREHYEAITNAIWAVDPNITVIGSGRWYDGIKVDGSPCLTGLRCDIWDDHYYRDPDVLAGMSTFYDPANYDRALPKVFVGEYAAAAWRGVKTETLRPAIAEAAFMVGFERNADVVVQASFAPLFRHVSGTQWEYDAICYNSSNTYGIPGYYVQKLFSEKRPAYTVKSEFSGIWIGVAGVLPNGRPSVKLVNYDKAVKEVVVELKGLPAGALPANAKVTTLSGDEKAANTLDHPEAVVPQQSTLKVTSKFTLKLPAWSVVVIDI